MRPKQLRRARGPLRVLWRVIALILSTLLTLLSVLALSAEEVALTEEPVTQDSSQISQATNASQLTIQGKELYEAGRFSEAVSVWQQAANAYTRAGDKNGRTQSWINMAEALQALGLYPRACNTLLQAFEIAQPDCHNFTSNKENHTQQDSWLKTFSAQPNSLTKAIGLRSLGNILQKLNNLELSTKVLQLSLSAARELHSNQNESAALLSLGNTFQLWGNQARARQDTPHELEPTPWRCLYKPSTGAPKKFYQQAASFYQQAATISVSPTTWVSAQTNRLNALLETNGLLEAQKLWSQVQDRLRDLPSTRTTVYAQINLAMNQKCLKQATATDTPEWREIAQTLATAVRQARSLGEQRAESYALGYLGGLYAQMHKQPRSQELTYAQDLTQQALTLARAIGATDIAYLWQWQLGLLLRTQGDIKAALAAYTEAVKTLQSLRSDLVASSTNAQFSFEESVEPIYRQLVDLLLQSDQTSQENLERARSTIEALQVAQLENLLKCNLQVASPVPIDREVDPTAAIIYPMILEERLVVILSLPGQELHHHSTPLPSEENMEDFLEAWRQNLQKPDGAGPGFLELSQQVYGWLVGPFETQLHKSGIKTLVFELDGPLRNIPMAALHDGQNYLIEKYAVALSPSLQLIEPKPLSQGHLEVLAAGISQKIPGFSAPALPEVKDELDLISQVTKSLVLRNQEFTRRALENQINSRPFSVVHLATHGQFSSNPDQTYIRAWDERIDVNQLKNLLQTRELRRPDPIELLVLSACETAEGDRRAALGLAGVAVRAGTRSTLATLWEVSDSSTAELMAQFYKTLSIPGNTTVVTKAQALQRAQLDLIRRYKAPFYWAPYVLVGNWL